MAKISTKINLWYILSTGMIILTMAITMYFLFESQRRTAIDNDLNDYGEFLVTGLNTDLTDMSELFNHLFSRKELPSKNPKILHFVLASSDSLIFETNAYVNLTNLLYKNQEVSKTTLKKLSEPLSSMMQNTEFCPGQ